jgi:hypothetical protein
MQSFQVQTLQNFIKGSKLNSNPKKANVKLPT